MSNMLHVKIKSDMSEHELRLALIDCYMTMDKLLYLMAEYEGLVEIMKTPNYENTNDYKLINKNIAFLYEQLGYKDGDK